MTNCPMTKECRMTNPGQRLWSFELRHSVIRHSSFLLFLLLAAFSQAADNVSVLGSKPRWNVLEHYQETITRDEFEHLLRDIYCTHGFADDLFKIGNDSTQILINRESHNYFTLRFATD